MRVEIIDYPTEEGKLLDLMYIRARTCYSSKGPISLLEEVKKISEDKKLSLVRKCLSSGHGSIAEIDMTFAIEGISRACSHQLVRFRHASFSQKSQRYVKENQFEYITPPSIKKQMSKKFECSDFNEAESVYDGLMEDCQQAYNRLIELGIPAEDARFVLPNACETSTTLTLNVRELIYACNLRLCNRAQWEIKQLFKEIKKQVIERDQWLKEYLQPKCVSLGYCKEDKCCGFMPTKQQIIIKY